MSRYALRVRADTGLAQRTLAAAFARRAGLAP